MTLGLCLMAQMSWGEKAYVSDSFEITLRTAPSVEHKIIMLLRSDQPVEVLEPQDKWTRVRVLELGQDNIEGWVMSRYLMTRQPWGIQARVLKNENASLKEKLDRLEVEWKEGVRREKKISGELRKNRTSLNKLQKKYEDLKLGSADYLKIKAEFEAAAAELERTQKTVHRLSKENENLRTSQRNKWFGMGALVLLSGLMIGLVIGRQQKKRKSLLYD
jgi:SH3 domain protein